MEKQVAYIDKSIIEIPREELLESLRLGYIEIKEALEQGNDKEDLAHIKGYCTTIEKVLVAYGGVTKEEIFKIKEPIIGSISLARKKDCKFNENLDIELETPSGVTKLKSKVLAFFESLF